jgi:hypothetical protein
LKNDDVLELTTYNALRAECKTKEQRKLFDKHIDNALDALANSTAYRGKSKDLYLQLVPIHCQLAALASRARKSSPPTTVQAVPALPDSSVIPVGASPNGNGAVTSHQQ